MSETTAAAMKYSIFSVADHYPADQFPGHTRTVGEFYGQLLDQAVLAEDLGYDTFFVAEHHFDPYGVIPNPTVWMAAAAQRTSRLKLAPAIAVLPFRDPKLVAEDYAMVDQLSGGRLVLGVGSGYLKHEFEGFNADGAVKRFLFDESLEIIRRLWTGERVTFKSDHYDIRDVAINVLPRQSDVPVYVATLRADVAYFVGKAGNNIMNVPYATVDRFEEIGTIMEQFRKGVAENPKAPGKSLVALHTWIADSDEAARAEAKDPFDLYVRTRKYAKSQTYDDIIASGLSLFGSVDTVVEKMVKLHAMGVDHVMTLHNFGGMDPERVARSMTLFAREVMPRVNARITAMEAA